MVGFVLFKWSPVQVFDGELGVLKHTAKIYPLDDNLYVKVEGTQAPNREKWHFVLVDREHALDEGEYADFTYYWGSEEHQYTDYSIPLKTILSGEVKNFRFTRRDAEAAYIWSDGDWKVATAVTEQNSIAFNWRWSAHAAKGVQEIADELISPNRVVRAKARKEMRGLSEKELNDLREMNNSPALKRQVEAEKARRK